MSIYIWFCRKVLVCLVGWVFFLEFVYGRSFGDRYRLGVCLLGRVGWVSVGFFYFFYCFEDF